VRGFLDTRYTPTVAQTPPHLSPHSQSTTTPGSTFDGRGRTIAVGMVALVVGAICGTAILHPVARPASLHPVASSPLPSPTPPLSRTPVSASGNGSLLVTPFPMTGTYVVSWTPKAHDEFIVQVDWGTGKMPILPQPSLYGGELAFRFPRHAGVTLEVQAPPSLNWSITFRPI
jgi:hypothetical protein